MSTQITAGLKKECMFIWRGFRLGGIILLFLGCALSYPLLGKMTVSMTEMLDTAMPTFTQSEQDAAAGSDAAGVSADGQSGIGAVGVDEGMMEAVNGIITPGNLYLISLGMISTAAILSMILLVGTAGREQKKRSVIIPQTAGLTPSGYVLPKFMLYPLIIFVFSLTAAFAADGVIELVFRESPTFGTVLLTGSLYGLSSVFGICMFFMFGICFAQPALSILYVLIVNQFLGPMLTQGFGVSGYTPWNVTYMADVYLTAAADKNFAMPEAFTGEVVVTSAITLILCAVFLAVTLFAMTAKRMDNTGDEVY